MSVLKLKRMIYLTVLSIKNFTKKLEIKCIIKSLLKQTKMQKVYFTEQWEQYQYIQSVHKGDKTSELGIISLGCRQMTERQVS